MQVKAVNKLYRALERLGVADMPATAFRTTDDNRIEPATGVIQILVDLLFNELQANPLQYGVENTPANMDGHISRLKDCLDAAHRLL